MEDNEAVQRNISMQREWYGEPLGDRVRRLVRAFDVSQANLADVLGISAPMLSQVMSGRRAKIGNPAVLARLIMLERTVLTPGVAAGDPKALRQALDDVRESRPAVTREALHVENGADEQSAYALLRAVAGSGELASAASKLEPQHPVLARLLRRAAHD